jgi:surfactin synthase thioesterase subunit/glycosyltransferase involved in cell wall biosynthesis
MRILLAHNKPYYPSHGGGDKSNRLLMEALAGRGHQCCVVARLGGFSEDEHERLLANLARRSVPVSSPGPDVVVFRHHEVEVHVVLHPRETPAFFAARIEEFAPDAILTSTDDPAQLLLETALKAVGPRVVYLARTTLDVPFGPDCAYPSSLKTDVLRRVDGAVGVSQYVAEYLRRWGGFDAVHVPISLLEPGPYPLLGRFDNEFVTLVNPCAVKGISIFLALAERMPAVRFAAVPTWGANREDMLALHRRPNIAVLKPVDDIDRILARTRVLLVPSLWAEARSRIIPEAMLRAVPVLAANVGGIPEAMLGVDYLLPVRPIARYLPELDDQRVPVAEVPEQDIAPWQAALERLLADSRHYERLSQLSREKALAYAAGLTVEPFEAYLDQLLQSPRKPRAARAEPVQSALDRLSPEKRRLLAIRLSVSNPSRDRKGADLAVWDLTPWFPAVETTSDATLRLFCFPFAGAGTSAFRGWAGSLPASIGVCPVRLPGRESRLAEVPFRHMEPLVRALAEAILPFIDRPFAFYGHSMGAAIAFELTRLLRKEGRPLPEALFVSGARAPRFRLGHVPPAEPTEEESLRDLDRLEGIPPEVRRNRDLLRVVLPALQADTALYRGYVYREEPPLDCPIFAYGGAEDPNVRREPLDAWRNETSGAFSLRIFPGGHFFIDTARPAFLAALSKDLRRG